MVKSADDGALDRGDVPWDQLDEFVRLLALQEGTAFVVSHQGYPTKIIVDHRWIISFDPNGVRKTYGIEIIGAASGDEIVAFFLRELASWLRRRIGNYGTLTIEVSNSRAWKINLTSCEQRERV